jgi:hypothetical protein
VRDDHVSAAPTTLAHGPFRFAASIRFPPTVLSPDDSAGAFSNQVARYTRLSLRTRERRRK